MTTDQALGILYFFLGLIALLIVLIIAQKIVNKGESQRQKHARDLFYKRYYDGLDVKLPLFIRPFFDVLLDIETQIEIDPEVRQGIVADLVRRPFVKGLFWRLKSAQPRLRQIAATYLGALKTPRAIKTLRRRLHHEPVAAVRFAIVMGIDSQLVPDDVSFIMDTLEVETNNYIYWISTFFKNRYFHFAPILKTFLNDDRDEVKRLFLHIAYQVYDPSLRDYCLKIIDDGSDEELVKLGLEAIIRQYPEVLLSPRYATSDNVLIKTARIQASSVEVNEKTMMGLIAEFDGSPLDRHRVNAISRIVFDAKNLLLKVVDMYPTLTTEAQKAGLTRVLSHHINYLVLHLEAAQEKTLNLLVTRMLEQHIVEDLIDFLNRNREGEPVKKLIPALRIGAARDEFVLEQLSVYLHEDLLARMGLIRKPQPVIVREKVPLDRKKIVWIVSWCALAFVLIPIIAFLQLIPGIFASPTPFIALLVRVNQTVIYYFLMANGIYLLLLVIAIFGSHKTDSLWRVKKATLLFEHDLLPSISIIAPAYNEEKSIVESVTSLLNLRYPTYEVIVVNDGSKDGTIDILINHFKLERKHPFFELQLATKGLRGVYVNPQIPNLIVIDKHNGGKADALNMGINAAKGTYVCGIDADSLLEENALLKMMSVTLDDDLPFIAIGGNIVPVNGCLVDRGKIEAHGLGKSHLVRFQTLEYLRAFTSGRIGWSELRSLLIISGAFGVFKRSELIEVGGYLTSSGKLKKDTVGEDMELVVRLTFKALQNKDLYRVAYVHHADCYTELPTEFKGLLRQRNRWQRGLLDILNYHKKLLFNPRYKQPGIYGFPYFFIFEMMGPFLEIMGYLALILGLSLGILNTSIVILLFTVTIAFGLVISLFSLLVAERRSTLYSVKETFLLILYAIIENLGFRQIISFYRAIATYSALKESGSWGAQTRTGFQKKSS
jgi:cellulose synthase/poly-beta-1,6-N-acetylglucosamine synthase-like glycosyltransferase